MSAAMGEAYALESLAAHVVRLAFVDAVDQQRQGHVLGGGQSVEQVESLKDQPQPRRRSSVRSSSERARMS